MARTVLILGSAFALFGAMFWQIFLRDALYITFGLGRAIQSIDDFPYQCRKITDKRLSGCEDLWLDDEQRM